MDDNDNKRAGTGTVPVENKRLKTVALQNAEEGMVDAEKNKELAKSQMEKKQLKAKAAKKAQIEEPEEEEHTSSVGECPLHIGGCLLLFLWL